LELDNFKDILVNYKSIKCR